MRTTITPRPELNDGVAEALDTLTIYPSSKSTPAEPVITLLAEDDEGYIVAGLRIDKSQAAEIIDTLLVITKGKALDSLLSESYYNGYDDGEDSGYEDGYEAGAAA